MKLRNVAALSITAIAVLVPTSSWAEATAALPASPQHADPNRFGYLDVFELEVAADPRISPDGSRVVYVRRGFDIMTDAARTDLWTVNADGTDHRALTDGTARVGSPRWNPDGNRLLYTASIEGSTQIFLRWMDSGQVAELTNLTESPGDIAWSPDGGQIAFTMQVPEDGPARAALPKKPEGAEWTTPPLVIDRMRYR